MFDRDFIIVNGKIVLPHGILQRGSIQVEEGRIVKVTEEGIRLKRRSLDARGRYIMPGMIDLHSDAIEKEIEPRPNSRFPIDIALFELDKKFSACGITTAFHAISYAGDELGIRSNQIATETIKKLNQMRKKFGIRTKAHARFEITDKEAIPYLEEIIEAGCIDLFSIMDHTPGQGQFKEVAFFKNYYGTVYQKTDAELEKIIERKKEKAKAMRGHLQYILNLCLSKNLRLVSHDDDSQEKVAWLSQMGVSISEFPVNLEAARAASERGIHICLGSPNALRGESQSKNLSAREAISLGYGNILCSDYSPMSMLHAVFTLWRVGILSLHEAVNLVSLHPAQAVGLDHEVGSIAEGKEADLVWVEMEDEIPKVRKAFVSGREVYSSC